MKANRSFSFTSRSIRASTAAGWTPLTFSAGTKSSSAARNMASRSLTALAVLDLLTRRVTVAAVLSGRKATNACAARASRSGSKDAAQSQRMRRAV